MSIVREDGYTREQAVSSVGKGWSALVDKVFDAVPADAKIVQVKEKFGKLRVYVEPRNVGRDSPDRARHIDAFIDSHAAMYDVIVTAEEESGSICEDCGKPGQTRRTSNGHWIRTVCDEHMTTPGH